MVADAEVAFDHCADDRFVTVTGADLLQKISHNFGLMFGLFGQSYCASIRRICQE